MDAQRLKDSFDRVAGQGDAVALFFYSDLLRGPSAMVGHTVEQLARLGVARDRIRLETFADAQR
ncbi:hypothetical protein [Actinomadura chokoriensis]|uniref:Uncharacterized protein n=1 Tax=Actinomadura chokoriensis TaxID=454156 RepID=A0ABV4R3W7_9ACTN